ncbi:MAG: efflux RND transporter periplasmic adaptor subunit [Gammaproteobacteria bacterium]|nr:efflux RND transporter periplasmic adaptor subunit [Gammaproteobacteria bacterium]MCY4276439.1 efflux RND transporter periplasmic adaptor subunit [Gammaproteobacteria bacterium]
MPKLKLRASNVLAALIALAMLTWLGSGVFFEDKEVSLTIAERNAAFQAASRDAGPKKVHTLLSNAQQTSPVITLRGFTRNKRTVEVRSESDGRVEARPVERGSRVEEGDLLCGLAIEDRQARLDEAVAARTRARLDYEGASELYEQGLVSDVELASRAENLARAKSLQASSEFALDRRRLRAPFSGVVETVHAEIGDFLTKGEICATLLDLDPMLVVGRVSEFEVGALAVGDTASAMLISGETVEGTIRFLGRDSSDGTKTYVVEVEVPNPRQQFRSGVTAEIQVPLEPVMAHRITPNLLRLDDAGSLGLFTVNLKNRAEFHTVNILRDDETGFWVTGLPEVAQLVVRGQGTLVPGQALQAENISLTALGERSELGSLQSQRHAETPAG